MILSKRLLLIMVMTVHMVLSAQSVEAKRGGEFISGEGETLITQVVISCTVGAELGYINGENVVESGMLELEASIWEGDSIDALQRVQTGTKLKSIPVTVHAEAVYANVDAHFELVDFSANDEIPGSVNGNLRVFWSEFGLSPQVGQWVLVESTTSFTAYEMMKIEECEPGSFPPPAAHCANETMVVSSRDLNRAANSVEYEPGKFRYNASFTVSNATALLSTTAEIVGRLYQPNDKPESWDPDFPLNNVDSSPLDDIDETINSAYGYVNSREIASSAVIPVAFDYTSVQMSENSFPLGLVLYQKSASTSPHVNIFEPVLRYVDSQTEKAVETFYFYPLTAPTNIKVTGVYFDNSNPERSVTITASAGDVAVSQSNAAPNSDGGANIIELTLTNVPRGTSSLDFTIESTEETGDAALLTGIVISYSCLTPVDNLAKIKKVEVAPIIDGAIDDMWQSANSYSINTRVIGDTPISATDLSAAYRALYDANNLYLLVDVVDNHQSNDSGSMIWQDDAIDIYLDGNKSRGASYDGVDDRQLLFRWNDTTPHAGTGSLPIPTGTHHSTIQTENGYRTEIAIPLIRAGINSTVGYEFGFDVHVHDDDNGGEREHKLAWNALVDLAWTDPSKMGIGRFVAAGNTPPVANDDAAAVTQNSTLNGASVLANDSDPDGDQLTVETTPVNGPANGTLSLDTAGTYRYVPHSNFVGTDSFVYAVSDGNGGRATATVTITVNQANRPPVANNDVAAVSQNSTLNGTSVLANDSDPDGDQLTVETTPVVGPANGTLSLNAAGTYRYVPHSNFVGTDSFVYAVSDGHGGRATATVTLTVNQANRPPVATDDTAAVVQDTVLVGTSVLANDSDPDGDLLIINTAPVSGVRHGSLTIDNQGLYTYVPTPGFVGIDQFVYTVGDGKGGSDTATVTIVVTSVFTTRSFTLYLPFVTY